MDRSEGYIDIHSHILPEVDDGAPSLEVTVRMLKQAMEQGIDTMIATPHYIAGEKNRAVSELMQIRDYVQEEAIKLNKDFRLFLGNELFYSESILEALKDGKALTLAGSRYVLVEFLINEKYKSIYNGLGNIIRAGYIPILAHVERYQCLHRELAPLEELHKLGCYLQMNSNSLLGNFLNTEAKYNRMLVYQGWIHFIGSDCHNCDTRVPKMGLVAELFHKNNRQQLITALLKENPGKIIENSYL